MNLGNIKGYEMGRFGKSTLTLEDSSLSSKRTLLIEIQDKSSNYHDKTVIAINNYIKMGNISYECMSVVKVDHWDKVIPFITEKLLPLVNHMMRASFKVETYE